MLIDELTMNGRKVSVATIAFGNTCLTMILALERPKRRAALTYSKSRARKNSARTTWTRLTQENRSRIVSSTRKLGARIADRMIRMKRWGSDDQISITYHQVEPAAEIALHRAREHADNPGNAGEDEFEQHRDAEAVDEARATVSCPSWSEPSNNGSSFQQGKATVFASFTPCFSSAARHWASLSIQVGGVGSGVGGSRMVVELAKRIGGQIIQPCALISLATNGSR